MDAQTDSNIYYPRFKIHSLHKLKWGIHCNLREMWICSIGIQICRQDSWSSVIDVWIWNHAPIIHVSVSSIMTARQSLILHNYPIGKVCVANMGPIWGQQDPGGPHIGPMSRAIWVFLLVSTGECAQWTIRINVNIQKHWFSCVFCCFQYR